MKKVFSLIMVLLLVAMVAVLASCGDDAPGGVSDDTGAKDTEEIIEGDFKISVKDDNGNSKVIGVNEDKELASYTITLPGNASETLTNAAQRMIATIEKKAGTTLSIGEGSKAIVCAISDEFGIDEYGIKADGDKIYVEGGSEESLVKAVGVFANAFIYGSNKSLLVPTGKGYKYDIPYYLDALTIDGVDIREFAYFSDAGNESYVEPDRKIDLFAERANEIFAGDLIGIKGLPIAESMEDGGHYIVVSANSSMVNPYSIKVENGNLYITGSFLSVDAAFDAFVSDVLGYTEGTAENGKVIDLTSANNTEGAMDLTVPYTKEELRQLFVETYEDDTKIISGTHSWSNVWMIGEINGTNVQDVVDGFKDKGSEVVALLELDLGKYGIYRDVNNGVDQFLQYDLSKLVSESMKHVSEGGVICICQHLSNPFQNGARWYSGVLPNGDADVKAMITEGTELNAKFRKSADATLRLLEAFKDNGVPVLFRPFHEMNADWFWWCVKAGGDITAESYVALWQYYYKLITEEYGVKDVLWVYSPSPSPDGYSAQLETTMYQYPGDKYVDIVGVDAYSLPYANSGGGYEALMKTGKPVSITETGPTRFEKRDIEGFTYIDERDYNCEILLNELKDMLNAGLKISYCSTWSNHLSILGLEGTAEFMSDPLIISREDLAEYWKNN
ncbi:MAG: hypothetical protein E7671_02175 [Ruminococcaceae bacterium]|nr:hypothetical protein [Oscillospiraceae bacterium]